VVFTKGAYDAFVNGTASSATAVEAPAEAPAAEAVEAEKPATEETAELPEGAKAPLKSGKAPKGYEVKAAAGVYHEPEDAAYAATEAECYFKSAEDAEAAGFTPAEGEAAVAAEDEEGDK
jgi:large subunit ribosomal protein L4